MRFFDDIDVNLRDKTETEFEEFALKAA